MSNADRFPCGDEIEEPTSTMSTTNDEQGYYSKGIDPDGIIPAAIKRKEAEDPRLRKGEQFFTMNTQAERAPMLSDDEVDLYEDGYINYEDEGALDRGAARCIRDHYESLITKGVLRVVKKAHGVRRFPCDHTRCEHCERVIKYDNEFCGCGVEIVKP